MKKMFKDPIVEEVHRTRERLLAKHGGSEGYAEHIRKMDLESERAGRLVTRPPRPPIKSFKR
jgi:hypothetical protein